jgi:hypothetical protein
MIESEEAVIRGTPAKTATSEQSQQPKLSRFGRFSFAANSAQLGSVATTG